MLDFFAVLGVPVTANEAELYYRYDFITKTLNPDRLKERSQKSQTIAQQRLELAREAFYELVDCENRHCVLSWLHHQARSRPSPTSAIARTLIRFPNAASDAHYEAAVHGFASVQYISPNNVQFMTRQLNNLNLVYLSLSSDESEGGQEAPVPRPPHPKLPSLEAEADEGSPLIP